MKEGNLKLFEVTQVHFEIVRYWGYSQDFLHDCQLW